MLGIDPGLQRTGYACLEGDAEAPSIVEAGVIRLRCRDEGAGSVAGRLCELDRDFRECLSRLAPEAVAVEALFAHYKHPATAIVMGHARGVLLLAIRQAGLDLVELRPAVVKKAATGYGRATKEQVQRSVQAAFGLASIPEPPDVADAIAIAWCASRRGTQTVGALEGARGALLSGARGGRRRRAV